MSDRIELNDLAPRQDPKGGGSKEVEAGPSDDQMESIVPELSGLVVLC